MRLKNIAIGLHRLQLGCSTVQSRFAVWGPSTLPSGKILLGLSKQFQTLKKWFWNESKWYSPKYISFILNTYKQIRSKCQYSILMDWNNCNVKPFHVVWDFRPWNVMTKVCYFLMVQTYNLRTLEVEHDLETCSRPWSTWILTLWASQGPENWKWSIKKYRAFVITSYERKSQTTWTSLLVTKSFQKNLLLIHLKFYINYWDI